MRFDEREKCSACPIRHRAICARCDDDELGRLEQIKSYRTFGPG
ncbi:MAG: transcriptional regulator, partial [Pseudomonadota bacterium]